MDGTATEAKSRLAHSVLISAARFDAMLAAKSWLAPVEVEPRNGDAFYAKYKDWVDEQNRHFEAYGLWNEAFRTW